MIGWCETLLNEARCCDSSSSLRRPPKKHSPNLTVIDSAEFSKAIVAAGLMSADEVQEFWIAAERLPDGASFGSYLYQCGRLTAFQVESLLTGSETPLVLGDYVILNRIGTGGMGQVFRAQHRHLKRVAAVKLLPPELTQNAAAVQRFQREAEAAARLSHPNVVQTYDAGVQRGVWYLAMEFVDGSDLERVLAAEGALSVGRAIDIVRQAAVGLAFAHDNGVIHRDVKPANLLINGRGVVKILDLGIARFADATAVGALTAPDLVMGTIDYLAPEQARDTRSADARADVYSLGCTLFRLLTNRPVYEGQSVAARLLAHQQQPIPSLSELRPDVPQPLAELFARMVAKDYNDRPQSMRDVVATLDSLARSAPADLPATVALRGAHLLAEQTTTARRQWYIAVAVAAVVAVGLAIWQFNGAPARQHNGGLPGGQEAPNIASPGRSAGPLNEREQIDYPRAGGLLLDRTDSVDLSAVEFDGRHDLTIEGWFKTTAPEHCEYFRFEPDGPIVFSGPKGESGDIATEWTDLNGVQVYAVCQQVLRSGEWQHIALAYRNKSMLLYVDGVPTAESPVNIAPAAKRTLKLGNGHLTLRALRISNFNRYQGKFEPASDLPNDKSTIANFRCDVANPKLLLDISGHERHGRIHGAEWLPAEP